MDLFPSGLPPVPTLSHRPIVTILSESGAPMASVSLAVQLLARGDKEGALYMAG